MHGTISEEASQRLKVILSRQDGTTLAGVNTIFKEAVALLLEERVAYTIEKAHPRFFFVHPKNSSGLGLSAHNCHRNGERIAQVGADASQLQNSYAFEVQPVHNPMARDLQIGFNKYLISSSKGLLADPTGYERFLTVGCGHTVAFCKAAAAHCITPNPKLQDNERRIDKGALCRDPVFKTMIEDGWSWTIIPAFIDEQFPELATIAQKALNASNHVASLVSELEVAKMLGDIMSDNPCNHGWEDSAINSIRALCPPCQKYVDIIFHYVRNFGGGVGSPKINLLDSIAKEFSCYVNLGQSFWNAVTHSVFFLKSSKFPWTRTCLVMANLTSTLVEDGFARLLGEGDIRRVCGKGLSSKVEEVEKTAGDASAIIEALRRSDAMKAGQELAPFGRLCVRLALLLTDKEKKGREGVEYKSVANIRRAFLADMSAVLEREVEFPPWSAMAGAQEKEAARPQEKEASTSVSSTFAEQSSPAFLLKEAGIVVGSIMYEKKVGNHHTRLYDVVHVGEIARLHACCTYGGDGKEIEVDAHVLLTEWVVTKLEKGGGPYKILSEVAYACTENAQFHLECRISETHQAIAHIHRSHPYPTLNWYRKPDEVHTSGYVAKGQLVFAPMGPVTNITTKQVTNSIPLNNPNAKSSGLSLWMVPLAKPQLGKGGMSQVEGKKRENFALVPFWWVWSSVTHEKEEANMVLAWKVYKGVHVPVLENTASIKPNKRLLRFVEKELRVPLANVAKVTTVKAVPEEPPKKRAKGPARAI